MLPRRHEGTKERLVVAGLLLVAALPAVVLVQTDAQQRQYASRNWPLPGGDLNFTRYSTLNQITRANVKQLGGAWSAELGQEVTKSAVVVQDGVMYLHTQQQLLALDAKTGRTLWAYKPPAPSDRTPEIPALPQPL